MLFDKKLFLRPQHTFRSIPLRIVGDAGIASPSIGDGRLIPAVILDSTERPDIVEYIRVHRFVAEGDASSQWGKPETIPGSVVLILRVARPVELEILIEFNIVRHGILVEQILVSKALYIQAGKEGDRVKHDVDAPKVIMEIADTGFRPFWDELYFKHLRAEMRERGLNRQDAKRAAISMIKEFKQFGAVRMPTPRSHSFTARSSDE
jgi:hypothetical protein